MYTGIIQNICSIGEVIPKQGLIHYSVMLGTKMSDALKKGASVSIDGVCQTVVECDGGTAWFDAIEESLQRTTLKFLKPGSHVNVERSARIGDEIGGHLLSGHVYGTAQIYNIERPANNCIFTFRCSPDWIKYLFPKGFIAINGASLTLVDVSPQTGLFTVHLIPETLRQTTFSKKEIEDHVNIELDAMTQVIVDTIERRNHDLYKLAR